MTTLQTADGRLLRAQRPAGSGLTSSGGFPTSFPPMWSDGERYPNGLTDSMDGVLRSFDSIYRSQPILAGVIDMIAFRAATLPFGAFEPQGDGSRKPVASNDSLATLLRRPRPRASTVHLLNHVFTSLLVHGNTLVAKLRTSDPESPPDMLWPLDWSQVTAYGEPGGDVEWWGTFQFDNTERYVRAEDTIHFAWPGPDGGPIGVSPLEKLGVTVRIEDAAQREQASMFRNGIRPTAAVSVEDPNPTREKLAMAREIVQAAHGGMDKSGSWVFTGANTKIAPLSLTPVEAALIDQRRLNREEVAIVFGLSGPSLTDSTNSALGNVAERFRAFYRDVLPPWATLVVETFEAQLLDVEAPWMDRLVRFDFSDKLRGEPRENAEKLKMEVEAGLRSRNEGRQEIGLPPEGDPNDRTNPANQLTANVNNQAPVGEMGAASTGSPTSRE